MIPLHQLLNLCDAAGDALAASVFEGMVLAVAVGLCLRLLPGLAASARSAIWMTVFMAVVLLHFLPFARTGTALEAGQPAFQLGSAWAAGLAGVSLSLSLFRAVELALGAFRLRALAQRATPLVKEVVTEVGDLPELKLGRKFVLCTSDDIDRPSVAGFFTPRILLPPGLLSRLTSEELRQVLLHESEHLRRGDDWTNLLQKLALVLFPLNPVLFWIERKLCQERELACDDRVLQASPRREAYALCLTRLAEHSLLRRGALLALGAWERQSELSRRVFRILARPEQPAHRRSTAAASVALTLTVLTGAAGLSRTPQIVRFGSIPQISADMATAAVRNVPRTFPEFRSPGDARAAKLVKASLPIRSKAQPAAWRRSRNPRSRRRMAALRAQVQRSAQFVAAGWRDAEWQPRLVLTLASGAEVSYTFVPAVVRVVPVANGWIVFQL